MMQFLCFSLTANGLRKILIFSPSRSSSGSFRDVTDGYPYFQRQLIGTEIGRRGYVSTETVMMRRN